MRRKGVYTTVFGACLMPQHDDFGDPQAPQREAALFYGLFLRGYPASEIRRDIEIPQDVVEKVLNNHAYEENLRKAMRRTWLYRKQVLQIFDQLVLNEKTRSRLQ